MVPEKPLVLATSSSQTMCESPKASTTDACFVTGGGLYGFSIPLVVEFRFCTIKIILLLTLTVIKISYTVEPPK